MSLSCSVRRATQMRSISTDQTCVKSKKIMTEGIAGNMPTSESAAQAKPVQVVQQDDVGFGCIFRTVRGLALESCVLSPGVYDISARSASPMSTPRFQRLPIVAV